MSLYDSVYKSKIKNLTEQIIRELFYILQIKINVFIFVNQNCKNEF